MTRQVPRSKIQPNIVANRSRSPAEHISKLTTPPTQNVKDIVDKSFDQLAIVTLRRDPLRVVGTKIAGYEFPGQGPFARATVLKNKGQGIDKRTRNANGLRCVATGKISKCKSILESVWRETYRAVPSLQIDVPGRHRIIAL